MQAHRLGAAWHPDFHPTAQASEPMSEFHLTRSFGSIELNAEVTCGTGRRRTVRFRPSNCKLGRSLTITGEDALRPLGDISSLMMCPCPLERQGFLASRGNTERSDG